MIRPTETFYKKNCSSFDCLSVWGLLAGKLMKEDRGRGQMENIEMGGEGALSDAPEQGIAPSAGWHSSGPARGATSAATASPAPAAAGTRGSQSGRRGLAAGQPGHGGPRPEGGREAVGRPAKEDWRRWPEEAETAPAPSSTTTRRTGR